MTTSNTDYPVTEAGFELALIGRIIIGGLLAIFVGILSAQFFLSLETLDFAFFSVINPIQKNVVTITIAVLYFLLAGKILGRSLNDDSEERGFYPDTALGEALYLLQPFGNHGLLAVFSFLFSLRFLPLDKAFLFRTPPYLAAPDPGMNALRKILYEGYHSYSVNFLILFLALTVLFFVLLHKDSTLEDAMEENYDSQDVLDIYNESEESWELLARLTELTIRPAYREFVQVASYKGSLLVQEKGVVELLQTLVVETKRGFPVAVINLTQILPDSLPESVTDNPPSDTVTEPLTAKTDKGKKLVDRVVNELKQEMEKSTSERYLNAPMDEVGKAVAQAVAEHQRDSETEVDPAASDKTETISDKKGTRSVRGRRPGFSRKARRSPNSFRV